MVHADVDILALAYMYFIFEYMCIYVCMYICMYVYMYVCMYVCMYLCMHVCMHGDWCNKGRGVWYPVCAMMYIKEPLLLID